MDVALMLQLDCQPVNSGSTLICPQNWVFQHDANPNFIENQTRGCCMTLFFVHISRELCCENTTKFVRVAVNQFYSFILEIFHFCRKIFCICPLSRSFLSPWLTLLLCHSQRHLTVSISLPGVCGFLKVNKENKKLRQEQRACSL